MFTNGLSSFVRLEYTVLYNEMMLVLGDGQLKIKADSILTTTSNTTVAEIYQG